VTRVAVITGLCIHNDAISAAVADQVRMLDTFPSVDRVVLFGEHIQRTLPCPTYEVRTPGELLDHREFASADIAIFHWGIRYGLFDALALQPERGPSIAVLFHNCTPEHLVPEHSRANARQSILQAQLMLRDDIQLWTFSEFNRATLESWGVPESRIATVPFRIESPRALKDRRRADTFDIASIGRFVPAKGQLTLIEALAHLDDELRERTCVRFAGNAKFSDPDYVSLLQTRALELGVRRHICFVGEPVDDDLWTLFEKSHLVVSTSLHEGLCVPIIEGYIAGCRAIGTTDGNLPFVVQSPDSVVPPNDPAALAAALTDAATTIRSGVAIDRTGSDRIIEFHGEHHVRRSLDQAIRLLVEGSIGRAALNGVSVR